MSIANCSLPTSASSWSKYILCGVAILMLAAAKSSATDAFTEFEKPPVLHAKDLAPATLLAGKGFQVDDAVPTDGLTAIFTIRSDVGTFQPHGVEMLTIRIAEIPAIQELEQTSKTKVFAQALARNGMQPVTAAGQMIMHPVDTVKGLPGGIGRFFGSRRPRSAADQGGRDGARGGLHNGEGRRACHAHGSYCQGHPWLRAGAARAGQEAARRSLHYQPSSGETA